MIVVKPVEQFDRDALLAGLGFQDYVQVEETTLEKAIYPYDDKVYIGQYQDCLIICDVMLSSSCLTAELSAEEEFLMKTFPYTEIGVFVLQSTVNFWGYAVLADGQKIRARAGSSDDGTFLDHGGPLAQEMALLAKSTVDADGYRMYTMDDYPDEPMTEDQMGEEFVFELSSRFFGEKLDRADDLLFETAFVGFGPHAQAASSASNTAQTAQPSVQSTPAPKPWWKFW